MWYDGILLLTFEQTLKPFKFMKKAILLFGCTLVFAASSYGQFSKGTILAGGAVDLNFSSQNTTAGNVTTNTASSTSFSFQPRGGYFIIDNLAAGASIAFSTSSTDIKASNNNPAITFVENSFGFSPFARYYYKKFFGQFEIGIGSFKEDRTSGNVTVTVDKGTTFNWSLGAGYALMLNEHVALEPQLRYASLTRSPDGGNVSSIRVGSLVFSVGLQVYLFK
jgi:hypothetical protein